MQFAGHDTFHIRDGWLHKGMSALSDDPYLFNDPYATDRLGVGRNMVDSIHYWIEASNLASADKSSRETADARLKFTELGQLIREHDRYLEEDLTLWALHYHLATNRLKATSWFWFFNKFPATRFDTQTALNYLGRWVEQSEVKRRPKLSSLQKDINCILRTYVKAHGRRRSTFSPEDSFESPFVALKLVDYLEHSESFKFNYGRRDMPPAAFAYASLLFIISQGDSRIEVTFQEMLSTEGSPGRAFLLSSEGLLSNIDQLARSFPKIFTFTKTAGLNTLRLRSDKANPIDLLTSGYEGASR